MRKPPKYLSLKRARLRQSWNIHNLYNLARLTGEERGFTGQRTFFQQKWSAKSRTRGYHGEHVPEKKWKRMFSRRLRTAVDMPATYLAAHDGSEQAAGRGSGLTTGQPSASDYWPRFESEANRDGQRATRGRTVGAVHSTLEKPLSNVTPLMQMTFAPLERRLDTAIFRALFASSIRQARQFVVHGSVKVNGKKMIYPSYQLNPGDMFQVDVPKVLQATGAPQTPHEKSVVLSMLATNEKKYQKMEDKLLSMKSKAAKPEGSESAAEATGEVEASAESPAEESAGAEDTAAAAEAQSLSPEDALELRKLRLECALLPAKLLVREQHQLPRERAMRVRNFKDRIGHVLSTNNTRELDVDDLITELSLEMRSLDMLRSDDEINAAKEATKMQGGKQEDGTEREEKRKALLHKALEVYKVKDKKEVVRTVGFDNLSTKDMRHLKTIIRRDGENPIDETKPYKTPWAPRPYMSPWVFVPRYLEVNHNICAAVYLRHPVARRGLGEVPTPFSFFTSQLAHNWYAERGG